MNSKQKEERLQQIQEVISKIDKKECNVYFMVVDTKGNPNGAVEYLYSIAYELHTIGYRVTMLHQEKDFIGVGEWMNEKYTKLPHVNVETENVEVGPSDFIFVPEFLCSVLAQMKNLTCKKIGVLCNKLYLTDVMPYTSTWKDLDVRDIITNTENNVEFIKKYFPTVKPHLVSPMIQACFRHSNRQQTPTVNIVAKNLSDFNYVTKTFYWRYPKYGWVSFKDVRGFPQEIAAKMFQDSVLTICVDRDSNFCYPAIEAVKCGSVVIGVIPNEPKAWMIENQDSNLLTNGILWADSLDDICDMVAAIIDKWIRDELPSQVYDNQKQLEVKYTEDELKYSISNEIVNNIFEERKNNFKEVYGQLSAAPTNDNENEKED